jgi:hypothetical protein
MATSEFGSAFAAARKAGDKTFEFNGKKYTTETAEETGAAKKAARNSGMRKQSDMISALQSAERNASDETSPLARQKIAEAAKAARDRYANADSEESMSGYKPRYTPAGMAPKTTAGARPSSPTPYQSMLSEEDQGMKRGGKIKKMASGGSVSKASSRGDGIATKGKTRGKMC